MVATDGNLSTHYLPATPFLPLLITLEDETYYTIVHPDNHESNIYLEVGGDFEWVGTSQSLTLGAIYDACEAGFTNPDFEEIRWN